MGRYNKSDLEVELSNGSLIVCKSGQEYDNLRTETLHGVVIDEVREQHPDLWPMVISPMLRTTGGFAIFVSTPNGFDSFYDIAERAKHDTSGKWAFFTAPSTANPLFTQEEYDDARKTMTEEQFAQEILAEFRDSFEGKVYSQFGPHNILATSPFIRAGDHALFSRHLPVLVCLDFNLSPMAWTLGQRRGRDFYFFHEIWRKQTHTPDCTERLVTKLKEIDIKWPVVIVGDSTGDASQRAAAGQSDYDIICTGLREAGIKYTNETPDANPRIKDRVNAVNAACMSSDGTAHLWVHPSECPRLKKDFERVSWKRTSTLTLDQMTDPDLTHSSDGVGYAIHRFAPVPSINDVGRLRVISR